MANIRFWSPQANVGYQSTEPAPDGAPEGMPAGQVNDHARETMAAVRRRLEAHSWFDYGDDPTFIAANQFSVADTYASAYEIGRRVRGLQGVDPTAHGTVTAASSGGGTTTVTLEMDSGDSLTSNLATVEVGISVLAVTNPTPIIQVYPASTTYTKPAGLLYVEATVVGGGGGGGGIQTSGASEAASSGGGGGGGTAIAFLDASQLGATETVTVGVGGNGGGTGGTNGGDGATSSFAGLVSATGGTGGTGSAPTSGDSANVGGTAGNGTLGTILFRGGDGGHGRVLGGKRNYSNFGGDSSLGGITRPPNSGSGRNGSQYGGGGSGVGNQNSTSQQGGDGAPGVVVVKEYF